ncbi:DUF1570 domain-containing protein [Calycomorphotria hydatis]|uniref:DUF1570 domain-containing protein n=1 Tax=Calycomorphotria hydatis TaxID=2528027 RepID=A0A517T7L1_9PLAN|nr:DUF1570 domain-containing protein [Calycomorphotria hydatis]QDT64366.1 hypothetical protein V22_16000 [Calycomorphotria hydatis]
MLHNFLHTFRNVSAVLTCVILFTVIGCKSPQFQQARLPSTHTLRMDRLVIVSDHQLDRDHELAVDLVQLQERVQETLQLPEPERDVVVYLFPNETKYRQYLQSMHPGLPPRRAYFVGTRNELAVYTFWGERIQEDLRHEYTHGILHASLGSVPLWLDEGLAEYFEVPGKTPGGLNSDYPHELASLIATGWRPDIARLEQIENFAAMRRLDYGESWAWVHYLMHSSTTGPDMLREYLAEIRTNPAAKPLSQRLDEAEPFYAARMLGHVADLNIPTVVVRANP